MQENETPSKKKMLMLTGLVAASMAVVPAVASAQASDAVVPDTPQEMEESTHDAASLEDLPPADRAENGDHGNAVFVYGDDDLGDGDLAEMREYEDELAAALDAAGIDYEWIEEEGGFRWVEIDWEDQDAVDVLEDFHDETFALSPEEIADLNAETEELADALRAAGVDATVTTDEDGVTELSIDETNPETVEAVEDVLDEFYAERDEFYADRDIDCDDDRGEEDAE